MERERLGAQRQAVVAGIAGNVMEWYDFSVYGYFATTIGRLFFPAQDAVSSLLAAFGVFAAGFLMRPLGSLVFGYIGDKKGRKLALTVSVALMALPTFLIGAFPTYEQIGSWASALLILMRFLQGLSVGGEYTTSSIFLVERSNPGRRGFLGSFVPLGSCAGVLLGSAIGAALTTVLDQSAVASWGWRIPFLIGLTIGIFGLYIRRHMIEDEVIQSEHAHLASPLGEAFRTEWRTIVRLIALGAVGAVGFYMSFVYNDLSPANRPYRAIESSGHQYNFDGGAAVIDPCSWQTLRSYRAQAGFAHRERWDVYLSLAAFLDVALPRSGREPHRSGRSCSAERVVLGRHPSDNGRIGADARSMHCAFRRIQRRDGGSWRSDTNGRRIHDKPEPLRPFAGLLADGSGGGVFRHRGRLAGDL
jgi:MFS family permease